MVAKQKPKTSARPEDLSSRGMSPKQLAIFTTVRRLIEEQGQAPTTREARQAHPEMSRGSFARNLKVLQELRYLSLLESEGGMRMELGNRAVREEHLWRLVDEGFARWSGGKPEGSNPPVTITPGPPVSDYVIQDRG